MKPFTFHQLRDATIPVVMAAAAVGGALAARSLLHPLLGENRPFLTFLGAVAVAAWAGGAVATVCAVALGYLAANFFFMNPQWAFYFDAASARDWGNALAFASLSLIISLPILALKRSRRSDAKHRAEIAHLLDEAREVNRYQANFLAMLSHELRNPLSPLSNALQIWPRVSSDPVEMERLRAVMSRQVQQLTRLLDDLLDATRIARGKLELRREPTDLRLLLATARETVQPLLDAYGHQLQIALPDEPLNLDADPARLTQVFANLLHNAAKFTQRGGRIALRVDVDNSQVTVRISDNGPGIPLVARDRIFEPFFQAQNSRRGGLGLGLSLAKQFVELHAGTIAVHSDAEIGGSEFVVTLPFIDGPLCRVESPSAVGRPLPRHRILVVDDVPESADTLAQALNLLGQEATPMYDGTHALDWIDQHRPDIVILDVAMPELDGYEVARRIRASTPIASIRLVALTGFGQPDDRARATAAGFDMHLTKPASFTQLQQLLSTSPRRERTSQQVAS